MCCIYSAPTLTQSHKRVSLLVKTQPLAASTPVTRTHFHIIGPEMKRMPMKKWVLH